MSINTLINPLVKFHHHILPLIDNLPQNGKALEMAKRILLVVAGILGLVALIGAGYNFFLRIKGVPLRSLSIDTSQTMKDFKNALFTHLVQVQAIQNIHSGKILVSVNLNGQIFYKEDVLKPLVNSTLTQHAVSQKIDLIVADLEKRFPNPNQPAKQLTINWAVWTKRQLNSEPKNPFFNRIRGTYEGVLGVSAFAPTLPPKLALSLFFNDLKILNRPGVSPLDQHGEFI